MRRGEMNGRQPELELSFLGRLFEPVLGDAELFLVLVVELDALLEAVDELGVWQLPQPLDHVLTACGTKAGI